MFRVTEECPIEIDAPHGDLLIACECLHMACTGSGDLPAADIERLTQFLTNRLTNWRASHASDLVYDGAVKSLVVAVLGEAKDQRHTDSEGIVETISTTRREGKPMTAPTEHAALIAKRRSPGLWFDPEAADAIESLIAERERLRALVVDCQSDLAEYPPHSAVSQNTVL